MNNFYSYIIEVLQEWNTYRRPYKMKYYIRQEDVDE